MNMKWFQSIFVAWGGNCLIENSVELLRTIDHQPYTCSHVVSTETSQSMCSFWDFFQKASGSKITQTAH